VRPGDEAVWHAWTVMQWCGFGQATASGGSGAWRSDRRCRDVHGAVDALWLEVENNSRKIRGERRCNCEQLL
jgi:hypothetical protein